MGCFLRRFDLFANFMELLISEKPLEGFHIVVDAGNGAGGFFAVRFLCSLICLLFLLIANYMKVLTYDFGLQLWFCKDTCCLHHFYQYCLLSFWEVGCPGTMLPLHIIYVHLFFHIKVRASIYVALAIVYLCSEMIRGYLILGTPKIFCCFDK